MFNTFNGHLLQELRRGTEKAEIFSLSFSGDSRFLACSSDRGTVHVFILKPNNDDINNVNVGHSHINNSNSNNTGNDTSEGPKNQKSVLGKISSFFGKKTGYFNSEWSFAKVSINESKAICCFEDSEEMNGLVVVGYSGKYYRVVFDKKVGGNGRVVEECKLGV